MRDLARAPERRSKDPWRPRRTGTKQIARAQMDRRSPKTWLRSIAVAAAVAVWPSTSGAQSMIAYRDGDGQWRWIEPAATEAFARSAAVPDETLGGTFRVT